ncbi:hypothetical protein [Methylobacterium gossipiicola]|uniref:Uncharacterized protein n=1 Tax=Methylobacterium gossipiicola TaxID=582675 RepID=A0A1I2XPH8_9HYPH|nr:hypothetical protein [Methylobacterium gossipiicola]SFH14606.1 hypothetical protein SAMN05192565_1523 [Methylobacterium gossipiicola]
MSGPWEKYAAEPQGPWAKYASEEPAPKREGMTYGEALKDGTAAVGHGLAKLAGAPVDLVTGAMNLASRGVNAAAGTSIPQIHRPFGGSESLSGAYDAAADAVGMTPPRYEDLPTRNKFAHNVAEVGTMLGAGGLAGAARGLEAAATPQAPTIGSVLADTVAPIRGTAPTTLAGDAGAVVGTAGAQAAVDENKSALDSSTAGRIVQAVAPMAGGAVGGLGGAVAAGAARPVRNTIAPEAGLPLDRSTGRPYSPGVVDKAAERLQGAALDPRQAAATLRENVESLRGQGVETLPAGGYLSDDPGLINRTDALRRDGQGKAGALMADRDRQLNTEARDRVDEIAAGANPRAPGIEAERQAAAMRETASQGVSEAQARANALAHEQDALGTALGQHVDRGPAAGAALDAEVVNQALRPQTAEKNRLFGAIDPDGTTLRPTQPYADRVAEIRRNAQALPPGLRADVLPERFLSAIDGLAPRIEERTTASPIMGADGRPVMRTEQVNTGGPGQISMRTVTEMWPLLSSAETQARRAGQFGMADNLRSLRHEMGQEVERLAAAGNPEPHAAHAYYAEQYGPTWARGPGDEASLFRKAFNEDPANRTKTPPSATAGRFLSSPEKAQALARILDSTPNPQQGYRAAREYILADLAGSGAFDRQSGRINLRYLRTWLSKNGEVARAVPELQDELHNIARQAASHEGRAQQVAAEMSAAIERQGLTHREIEDGVLGLMTGRDPAHLVEAMLGSRDPQATLRQAVGTLRGSPEAVRGLSRAIAEHVAELASTPNVQRTANDKRPVSPTKLQDLLDRFGPALAEALPPEDMRRLRTSANQLRPGLNRGLGGAAGPAQQDGGSTLAPAGTAIGVMPGGRTIGRVLGTISAALPAPGSRQAEGLMAQALASDPETLGKLLLRVRPQKAPLANHRANGSLGALMGLQNNSN